MAMRASIRKWLWHGLSGALAVGILALLLSRQKWQHLSGELYRVNWPLLAAAAGLAVAYWAVRTARWRWVAALEQQRIGWGKALVSMLAGLGVGLITPLRGGEIVRPMFLPKGARLRLAGYVVIEKMFDLSAVLSLCLLGLVYMVFAGAVLAGGGRLSPWLLLLVPPLLAAALGVPLLLHYRPRRLWAQLSRLLPGKAKELAETRLQWRQFGIFYGVSMLAEVLSILAVFCCLRAYGHIELIKAVALTPVVMLHNLVPATPAGFGVREGTAVVVFGAFGFSEGMVLAAYLTNAVIVLLIPGCVGIVAAWISGLARALEAES